MTIAVEDAPEIAALAPFGSLPAWLAAGMDATRVGESLTQHVRQLADGDLQLVSCTADRLRAKGSDWLCRYTVTVAAPGGEPRDIVLVGTLSGPHRPPVVRQIPFQDVMLGEPGWRCTLPDLGLDLHVQATDAALPALPRLVEAESAAQLLQPILRDAGYIDATITSCEPVVVRYKPGSRCTVVVRLSYADPGSGPTPPNPVVLKTHQGDKGEAAWAAMNALWQCPDMWRHAVRLAEPLGFVAEDRILVQGPVPEDCTLKDLARKAITVGDAALLDSLRGELAKTARALAAVHRCGAAYGRTATLEQELAEVAEVVDRLSLSVPQLAQAARPLLDRLAALSDEHAADPAVPAHHDFRPAQVLLHSGGVGFIDFDGACMAEPALDLGRFRAKLRDIGISALMRSEQPIREAHVAANLSLLDDLCEHFLLEYQQHATVSRDRVLLWEACDLLTTMLHAWTKVRRARLEPRLTVLVHQLRTSGVLTGSS